MSTLIDALGAYLQTKTATLPASQQLVLGKNLFLGRLPAEAPNASVLIQQYEGQPPTFSMGTAVSVLEHPRIQILVRGEPEDYPDAYNLCYVVRNILGAVTTRVTLSGVNVLRIEPMGVPNYMAFDEVNRPRFSNNFEVTIDTP